MLKPAWTRAEILLVLVLVVLVANVILTVIVYTAPWVRRHVARLCEPADDHTHASCGALRNAPCAFQPVSSETTGACASSSSPCAMCSATTVYPLIAYSPTGSAFFCPSSATACGGSCGSCGSCGCRCLPTGDLFQQAIGQLSVANSDDGRWLRIALALSTGAAPPLPSYYLSDVTLALAPRARALLLPPPPPPKHKHKTCYPPSSPSSPSCSSASSSSSSSSRACAVPVVDSCRLYREELGCSLPTERVYTVDLARLGLWGEPRLDLLVQVACATGACPPSDDETPAAWGRLAGSFVVAPGLYAAPIYPRPCMSLSIDRPCP